MIDVDGGWFPHARSSYTEGFETIRRPSAVAETMCRLLARRRDFSREDIDAICQLDGEVRTIRRGRNIISARELPSFAVVVLHGLLVRQVSCAEGFRRITALYLPGDPASFEVLHGRADSNVGAAVAARVGLVRKTDLCRLVEERPNVLAAFTQEAMAQASIHRAWLVRNCLPAAAALAHLFCEIVTRECARTGSAGHSCELPLTQEVLGEMLGLTAVHVNRTLKVLRGQGLVDMQLGRLIVHDFDGLSTLAQFDPYYLDLRPRRLESVV
jgi:CRP-like cAMP-binding protein